MFLIEETVRCGCGVCKKTRCTQCKMYRYTAILRDHTGKMENTSFLCNRCVYKNAVKKENVFLQLGCKENTIKKVLRYIKLDK